MFLDIPVKPFWIESPNPTIEILFLLANSFRIYNSIPLKCVISSIIISLGTFSKVLNLTLSKLFTISTVLPFSLSLKGLEVIKSVFTSDPSNYF